LLGRAEVVEQRVLAFAAVGALPAFLLALGLLDGQLPDAALVVLTIGAEIVFDSAIAVARVAAEATLGPAGLGRLYRAGA
jgi:hypothetical protein